MIMQRLSFLDFLKFSRYDSWNNSCVFVWLFIYLFIIYLFIYLFNRFSHL
jgi:hypothetical protein